MSFVHANHDKSSMQLIRTGSCIQVFSTNEYFLGNFKLEQARYYTNLTSLKAFT